MLGPRIPPPSALVMQQYEEARLSVPEDVRPGPFGAGGVGSAKSWIRRLRRRWGGRHGNLRVRDEPHADGLQAKARDWGMFVGRALVAWPPARFGGSSGVPGSVGRVGRDPSVILRAKRVRVGCRRRDRSGRAAQ